MNIFVEIENKDKDEDNPNYINILYVNYIKCIKYGNGNKETCIIFKNKNELYTKLSTKEVMKRINKAYNSFENKEIVKKMTRFEIMDLED